MSKTIQCPYCSGNVLVKETGKAISSQPLMKQRFSIRNPLPDVTKLLFGNPEKDKKSIQSGPCKGCGGKGTIPDPHDDSQKYNESQQKAQSVAENITKEESKLGQPGGSRYTIIRGSDLLEVGLGFNNKPSYRVDPNTSVSNNGIGNAKVPMIPSGSPRNTVVGIPALWPEESGTYMIKCAHNFQVLVGSGGIKMTTGGPLVISGGITQITGPEVTIGSQSGGLNLEGETVNIKGKSIEATPSSGHFFVKGTISNTGNMMCGGHAHAESLSFVNATCAGRNDATVCKVAAPADMYTGPAVWGGVAMKAITAVMKEITVFTTTPFSEPETKSNLMTSPRGQAGLKDKMMNLAYLVKPWETKETGYILPGTQVKFMGKFPCNYGGSAFGEMTGIVTQTPGIKLNNFPHCHGLPDLIHTHDIRVPDIDFTADDAEGIRGKAIPGLEQNAPKHVNLADKTKSDVMMSIAAKASGSIVSAIAGKTFNV